MTYFVLLLPAVYFLRFRFFDNNFFRNPSNIHIVSILRTPSCFQSQRPLQTFLCFHPSTPLFHRYFVVHYQWKLAEVQYLFEARWIASAGTGIGRTMLSAGRGKAVQPRPTLPYHPQRSHQAGSSTQS